MIICPSCGHEEMVGAMFCSECGTRINQVDISEHKTGVYTDRLKSRESKETEEHTRPKLKPAEEPFVAETLVSLRIINTGSIIHLESGKEFTLGRISGNQPILPDVDLTPFNAYEDGVSRLHATIKISPGTITLTDLGSANGTRINGKKVPAHELQKLESGDILTLGKFKLQVHIHT